MRLYSAPGRTEIGGNHTDHNNGVVLAGSVNLDIVAVVSPNNENIVRVKSHGFEKIDDVDLSIRTPQPREGRAFRGADPRCSGGHSQRWRQGWRV